MKKLLTIAATSAAFTMLPAGAQTYDAFSSFTGTNTGGAFTYGVLNGATFTPYSDASGCTARIPGTICTSNGDLPAAFKTESGAFQSGTVLVPSDALVLHPGADAGQSSAVLFTAPLTSDYRVSFSSFIADTNPSGVMIDVFIPGVTSVPIAELTASNPSFSFSEQIGDIIPAGAQFGFAVDYDGVYYDDSTGIKFSVTAVPEPATWAMMVFGFGMVGFGLRYRRKSQGARVKFA